MFMSSSAYPLNIGLWYRSSYSVPNQQHRMKAYGELEVEFHEFLTSALEGGQILTSCIGLFAL